MVRKTNEITLDLSVIHDGNIDWAQCDSEKTANIARKVNAVLGENASADQIESLVNIFVESYIVGIELMKGLRISYPEIYEDIVLLEQSYKKEVSIKTQLNPDSSMNYQLFDKVLSDFEEKLKQAAPYLSVGSHSELKLDLVSSWLADCSMEFRR